MYSLCCMPRSDAMYSAWWQRPPPPLRHWTTQIIWDEVIEGSTNELVRKFGTPYSHVIVPNIILAFVGRTRYSALGWSTMLQVRRPWFWFSTRHLIFQFAWSSGKSLLVSIESHILSLGTEAGTPLRDAGTDLDGTACVPVRPSWCGGAIAQRSATQWGSCCHLL
jgi:hypothetical protein